MKKWDIQEFVSHLNEAKRRLGIGDNIEILYQENLSPIKINGEIKPELKIVKGSYCIYDMEEQCYFKLSNKVEIIVIEEYSDSPYSIYINEDGLVESYEYEAIKTIELGSAVLFQIKDNYIIGYQLIQR
jgi:hypothetical protein